MFFLISVHFNKRNPEDFGLIKTESPNIFVNPKDGTQWEKRDLIDFGWGIEVTFCKLPYLPFNELLELSFYKKNISKRIVDFDFYGSIGILLYDYPYELLDFTEKILVDRKNSFKFHKEFFRTVRTQMRYNDKILKNKWQTILEQINEF